MDKKNTSKKEKQEKGLDSPKGMRLSFPESGFTEMATVYRQWLAYAGYTSFPPQVSVECTAVRLGQCYPAYTWRAYETPPNWRSNNSRVSITEKRTRMVRLSPPETLSESGENRRGVLRNSKGHPLSRT